MFFRALALCMIPGAAGLFAADPAWNTKPVDQWTAEEAQQLLSASGWVKQTRATVVFQPSEDQLRQGGQMGGGKGAGLDNLDPANLFGVKKRPGRRAKSGIVTIRWESAAPVRAAEEKLKDDDVPDWDGEYYAIAIYGVPVAATGLDNKTQTSLQRFGVLKLNGEKDVKAVRVEVGPPTKGLATVLYLFPRATAVPRAATVPRATASELHSLRFSARLGGLAITQSFSPAEMLFQGKLAL